MLLQKYEQFTSITSKKTLGIYSSIIPRSLENLFKILPDGFVLKKRMEAFITLEKI